VLEQRWSECRVEQTERWRRTSDGGLRDEVEVEAEI
jgi:hypothetical protein